MKKKLLVIWCSVLSIICWTGFIGMLASLPLGSLGLHPVEKIIAVVLYGGLWLSALTLTFWMAYQCWTDNW